MFLLCAYADSDRWVSAIEPLLYPTHLSFYRPFSYRKNYFLPEQLAEQLADASQLEPLLRASTWNEGVFGIRFRETTDPDFRPFFLPLRTVSLAGADRPDELNVRFRLGPFVEPILTGNPQKKAIPRLDLSRLVGDISAVKLFIQLRDDERRETQNWTLNERFPHDFWDALLNSLSPIARQKILNTTVMRLDDIKERKNNQSLVIEDVDRERRLWGYKLRQGTTYDVRLSYKRLVERGGNVGPVENLYVLTNPSGELQAARQTLHIVGNYRSEEFWICPRVAIPGPIAIALEPARVDRPDSVVDQAASQTVGIKIPVFVEPSKWPVSRLVNLWFCVVCLLGIAASGWWYSGAPDQTQRLLLLVITALVSMLLTSAKDVFIPKT